MSSEDYGFTDDLECYPGKVAGKKQLCPKESLLSQGQGIH